MLRSGAVTRDRWSVCVCVFLLDKANEKKWKWKRTFSTEKTQKNSDLGGCEEKKFVFLLPK